MQTLEINMALQTDSSLLKAIKYNNLFLIQKVHEP